MEMKLEVVFIPVSDVDRAKQFYQKMGFRLDIDYAANQNFRVMLCCVTHLDHHYFLLQVQLCNSHILKPVIQ